jgi:hypothetical protein
MEKRSIEKTLDAFQIRDLQTFKTIILALKDSGWTIVDAFEHIDTILKVGRTNEIAYFQDADQNFIKIPPNIDELGRMRNIPMTPITMLKRKCPDCGRYLNLDEVNHHPGLMVGGNFKSQWHCKFCHWEECSEKIISEEALPYVEELDAPYIPEKKGSK